MLKFDKNLRVKEIDFLRGIAVLLVLICHHFIFLTIAQFGWVGVDLFFVLSGFLVSGLLFGEYKKYGNVKPGLFLIRRGFKIYPLFYFSILCTVVLMLFLPNSYVFENSRTLFLNRNGIAVATLIESLFLQSYFFGFWTHHWSLSVEEMFYVSLVFTMYIVFKWNFSLTKINLPKVAFLFFLTVLAMRIVTNIYFHNDYIQHNAFHLRVDSLVAGVIVSYYYNFRTQDFESFYKKYKRVLIWVLIICITSVYFASRISKSFVLTFGYTLLWMSFSSLLIIFLFEKNISNYIRRVLGARLYRYICVIGFYSYSIYLFHYYIIRFIVGEHWAEEQFLKGNWNWFEVVLSFIVYIFLSILLGIAMSRLIEMPMLKIRDKYFSRRLN